MQETTIRIGTRGSPLALAQAYETRRRFMEAHAWPENRFAIVVIKTTGDKVLDRPLAEIGGKGLFTKELEEALYANEIDLAVHSMKDMATVMPPGLGVAAVLPREDVRDAFISLKYKSLAEMPPGAVVGTSSLRRQAQVKHRRADLNVAQFRGNVQTRLKKLADGVADATFLAVAGLRRLGLEDRITSAVSTDEMLPAVAQGAIAIQTRDADDRLRELMALLDHAPTARCVAIERAFLERLEGSCRTPIAGLAEEQGGDVRFRGMILTPDGSQVHETGVAKAAPAVEALPGIGYDAADELLDRAGPDFFKAVA